MKFDSAAQNVVAPLTSDSAAAIAAVKKMRKDSLGTYMALGLNGCAKILGKKTGTRQKVRSEGSRRVKGGF